MSEESTRLSSAREPFALREGEALVWVAALDLDENRLRALDGVLSPDERERAGRFIVPLHGKRFVAARGVLRVILARSLGTEPAKIGFSYGSRGKPLLSTAGRDEIRFNVSHAADRALIVVTKGREIGVDIESIGRRPFDAAVVRRFFSAREGAALRSVPEAARAGMFTAFWARKEACIKASGLGLFSYPLASFDVSGEGREPRVVVSDGDAAEGARSWTLADVEAAAGFAAACAVEGAGLHIIRREFRF